MNIRQWITLCESEDQILPITVADERATDIYTDLDTCERVIWEKTNIIDTYELNEVGLGEDVNGVYGIHITGDTEFWFTRLVKDYDRDPLAYVIEIKCLDTDVKYVRTLTKDDNDRDEDEDDNEDDELDQPF